MWRRDVFNLVGTTEVRDTGHGFGFLKQIAWKSFGDSGGDIEIQFAPDPGDTGTAISILSDGLTPHKLWSPVQPTHHADGFDTGAAQEAPYFFWGDRLRIRVANANVNGRLWVWWAGS